MSILGSTAGVVFASTLHTAGAIGFLAGLMLYVAWARGLRRGDEHVQLLNLGATLTYVAILANLMGGFMRTYQPGHPKAWDLFVEPWAMIMVVKHIFLFIGMFAAAYLFEIVAPKLRRAAKADEPLIAKREGTAVGWVMVGILVATVLGAVVGVTPIKSMQMDDDDPTVQLPTPFLGAVYDYSGTVSGGPLAQLQSPYSGQFQVPPDVPFLDAVMDTGVGSITLTLTAPGGRTTSDATTAQDNQAVVHVDAPANGTWTFTITATSAVQATFTLEVTLPPAVATYQEATETIAPGQAFTIQLSASTGDVLAWDWSATEHLAFEVRDSALAVRAHEDNYAGSYTATENGPHRFVWSNQEALAVTVSYKIWGDFTLA